MTNEEAIEFLKQYLNSEVYTDKCLTAHAMAISALQSVRDDHFRDLTKMIPLTIEELRKMDGQPVWVQTPGIERYGRWVIVAGVDTDNGQKTLYCQGDYTCRNYGKTWEAYAYPPAHIDREAWNCEFCNRFNFSVARTETDKYGARILLAGGVSAFPTNVTFKHCPECGRPLTEEAWAELEKRLRG